MHRNRLLPLLLFCLSSQTAPAAEPFEWETTSPESQGMSTTKLDALKDVLAAHRTRAFLVVRNDHIVYEWYADGTAATNKQGTASLAKAIVGGMSLAVALTDAKLSLCIAIPRRLHASKRTSKSRCPPGNCRCWLRSLRKTPLATLCRNRGLSRTPSRLFPHRRW